MKFIIDFKNDVDQVTLDSYLQANQCTLIKVFDNFNNVILVDADSAPPLADIVETITNDDEKSISPLNLEILPYFGVDNPAHRDCEISINDDTEWWKTYSFYNLNFEQSTVRFKRKGSMVDVYMVDSGIDASHPEFVNSTIQNLFSFNNDFTDYNGHGTALSSLIIGETCGITDARLKVVKIFQQGITTKYSDLLSAFDEIINDKKLNLDRPSYVNLSWSIPKDTYLENKIRVLISYNVYVVAAAGNSGLPIGDVTPASMNDVVTVGAYNTDFQPCDFSSYQPTNPQLNTSQNQVNYGELDGWAPGENIRTAVLNGAYANQSGTSFSAAITTAVMVYNMDDFVYDTSSVGWKELPQSVVVNKAFFRGGMLSFDQNVYASQSNRILSWILNGQEVNFQAVLPYIEKTIQAEEGMHVRIFDNLSVKSTELLTTLPSYITWSSLGFLIVNPTSLDQDFITENIQFKTIDNNDLEIDQTVKLIVFKSELLGTLLNVPDSEVPIKALAVNQCSWWNYNVNDGYGCYYPYEIDGCNENCATAYGSGFYCVLALCPYDKLQDACTCFNPSTYSDILLKTNIKFLFNFADLNFYEFNYKWDYSKKYIGVIAQELIGTIYETCVKKSKDKAYYLIDYCRLKKVIKNELGQKNQ